MEMAHWFYAPASQAGRDLERGAAALMDLAAVEAGPSEVVPPSCKLDLLRMGADCRRRGMEMVVVRDSDFKFLHLLEISAEDMEMYRGFARGANRRGLPMSEVLEFSRQERGVIWIRFVKPDVLKELVERTKLHPVPMIGLPLAKAPGLKGLHLPNCSHRAA
jgi:hypothetical protein